MLPAVWRRSGVLARALGADCALPVAAYAKTDADGEIYLQALVAESDGSMILRADGRGEDPQVLAQKW